jgi:hypothetical protein
MRAARTVLRQAQTESLAPLQGGLTLPAMMLAAMACEDILKAVVVAKRQPRIGGLPQGGHDLEELARSAGIPATGDEVAALKAGKDLIMYAGRYPTGVTANATPGGFAVAPNPLWGAYEQIFLRCGEELGALGWTPELGPPDSAKGRAELERRIAVHGDPPCR